MTARTAFTDTLDSLTVTQLVDLHDEAIINADLLQLVAQRTNIKSDWDAYRKAINLKKLLHRWIQRAERVDSTQPNLRRASSSRV